MLQGALDLVFVFDGFNGFDRFDRLFFFFFRLRDLRSQNRNGLAASDRDQPGWKSFDLPYFVQVFKKVEACGLKNVGDIVRVDAKRARHGID